MSEAMDKAKFEMAVAAERQRQIEKGYTPAHDDKKGAKHLINWACDYIVKGEPVKAMALLVATLQHLERLSPAQLPDRETLTAAVCSVTDLWDEPLDEVHDVPQIVNAVLAALSTQPAAGEVEWEYGHDCDDSREICGDDGGPHHEWEPNPECVNVTLYRRRPAGAWEKTQPEPTPELAELFPGTVAALDHLSIRPEVQP